MKNRVKDLREDYDLTQQQVAEAIGITQRKYSYIETGIQPLTADILVKLSNFYHVSIDYLLAQTQQIKPVPTQGTGFVVIIPGSCPTRLPSGGAQRLPRR